MHLTVTDDRSHRSDPEARNNFYIDVFIYNNSHYQKKGLQERTHRWFAKQASFTRSILVSFQMWKSVNMRVEVGVLCGFKHKLQCCEHSFPLKMLIWPLLWGAEIELTVITWPDLYGKHINRGRWLRRRLTPYLTCLTLTHYFTWNLSGLMWCQIWVRCF